MLHLLDGPSGGDMEHWFVPFDPQDLAGDFEPLTLLTGIFQLNAVLLAVVDAQAYELAPLALSL